MGRHAPSTGTTMSLLNITILGTASTVRASGTILTVAIATTVIERVDLTLF